MKKPVVQHFLLAKFFLRTLIIVIFFSHSIEAHAYLDPGTGSMLLSALIGILVTFYYLLNSFYYKTVGFILGVFGYSFKQKSKYKYVFYSEGKQYWNSFRPVIEALDKLDIELTYLTSDKKDQGLHYQSKNVTSKYIGTGNKAYTILNMLNADICIMTTPGLDVLQIRRSKGVKHYAHIIHAPTDIGIYKLYSFDYYDSVLCSGEHQIKSIRTLESYRKTDKKLLLKSGCPYMDVWGDRLVETERETNNISIEKNWVLIAPTWGTNGGLQRFGVKLIRPLLDADYQVIIRPHPQSFIVENDVIEGIKKELCTYENLHWDKNADGFFALNNSDVMISDISGVIFDYAFIFEKPVITIDFEVNLLGLEGNDLPYDSWEISMLDKVGKRIHSNDIASLPSLVTELLTSNNQTDNLGQLRNENIYNFRGSGDVIAKQLINIRDGLVAM